jgi:hypothetical protein
MALDEQGRIRVAQIAQNFLEKDIGALEAVRALLPLLQLDSTLVSREDRKSILAISRETDDLPVGRVREVWHPDQLAEKDKEIEKYEKLFGETVRSICLRLVRRHQSLSSAVKYVGLPDFHDGHVRVVAHEPDGTLVTVEGYSGGRYLVSFDGVTAVEMSSPEGMGIYAVSESATETAEVRIYEFLNWSGGESEQAYLRVFAKDFKVKQI